MSRTCISTNISNPFTSNNLLYVRNCSIIHDVRVDSCKWPTCVDLTNWIESLGQPFSLMDPTRLNYLCTWAFQNIVGLTNYLSVDTYIMYMFSLAVNRKPTRVDSIALAIKRIQTLLYSGLKRLQNQSRHRHRILKMLWPRAGNVFVLRTYL